jgi:four helix bundle protein
MRFAVQIFSFCREFGISWETRSVAEQLLDCATSTAMNYRACGRGRSTREFVAKLGLVVEEADETAGWLELIERADLAAGPELQALRTEASELVAIFAASYRTARANQERLRATRPQRLDKSQR